MTPKFERETMAERVWTKEEWERENGPGPIIHAIAAAFADARMTMLEKEWHKWMKKYKARTP